MLINIEEISGGEREITVYWLTGDKLNVSDRDLIEERAHEIAVIRGRSHQPDKSDFEEAAKEFSPDAKIMQVESGIC